ncbi:MAG: hypothetical protein KGY81_05650, partial [Phycisphaerae bacterium]|nr:hypothetical protein [Phycisphaerae bacterium]
GKKVLALIHDHRDELSAAADAIAEALRINPEEVAYHAAQAGVLLQYDKPQQALEAAERGLAIDAENEQCGAYRSMALIQLNRTDEAAAASDETLQRNPNSALAHAQTGWGMLHRDKPHEAREHFREALRIDPNSDWARDGMLECLKVRSVFYRMLLRYFLWMSRLRGKAQWGVILAIWLIGHGLQVIGNVSPIAQVVVYLLLGLYFIFLYLTWVAQPLSDATLLFNRDGWIALPRERRTLAIVVAMGTTAALGLYSAGQWISHGEAYTILAAATLLVCILCSTAFSTGWTRKPLWLTLLGVGLIAMTAVSVALFITGVAGAWGLGLATIIAIGLYMIICNLIVTRVV